MGGMLQRQINTHAFGQFFPPPDWALLPPYVPRGFFFRPSAMQWTRGTLFDRRVHGDYRRARSRLPLTRCPDGKSIGSPISRPRRVFVSSYVELFQPAVYRLL